MTMESHAMPRKRRPKTTFFAGNAAGLKDIIDEITGFPARIILPESRHHMTIWVIRNKNQLTGFMRDFDKHCKKGRRLVVESARNKRRRRR